MRRLETLNLVLRAAMELGVVCGLGYWGYHTGTGPVRRAALALAAPALGFGFWGAVDFRHAGVMAEPLRLVQELAISGLSAGALFLAGQPVLGGAMVALSVVHHVLVYALGGRLLR
ncbi:MAG TPA: YrdB family protein [Longimicrobiales bacterium]|nr:YrdB family protein [Longimicrobiales bacterium]